MKIKKTTVIIALFPLLMLSCSREQLKPLNVKRNFSGSLWVVCEFKDEVRKIK